VDQTTRDKIVECARSYLGTPFHHQGRVKGVGIDCAGVPIGITHDLGFSDWDTANYGMLPNGNMMRQVLDEQMESIPVVEATTGDLLLFGWSEDPQHVGIITKPGYILHTHARVGKVVEHRMDSIWRCRIRGAYRFRVKESGVSSQESE
jgi:cell wall-associated NlpC family hydrolase